MDIIDVAAGIIWRGDRFLTTQRPPGTPLEGYWEFPGGKQEDGEDARGALARELAEELGIAIKDVTFWQQIEHDYAERNYTVRLHFFHVRAFNGEPCPREGQNMRWVTPVEALELDFLPADTQVLAQLVSLRLLGD